MDCRNGEVLAMATNPSFDPSVFNSGVSQAQWLEWTKDRRTPLINKATSGLYAPGSTFKMAVALAGLESKAITPTDHIGCPGWLDLGDTRFHCWRKGGHGMLDLRGGLKNSCDVYFYEVARRTGIDRIAAMANRLGLGIELQLDLPGQRTGLVPTREWRIAHGHAWNMGDTVVSGIGQGFIQVTPLQLATYASRLASGRMVEPHLTRGLGGVLQPGSLPDDWPVIGLPEKLLHNVREGMWAVVNEQGGTAPLARLADPNVQLARAARERAFRQREASLGVPPARAVRRLCAVRLAALCPGGGDRARQRGCRSRRAAGPGDHDGDAAARPGQPHGAAAAEGGGGGAVNKGPIPEAAP
jgi:penicillin-binding protein 2